MTLGEKRVLFTRLIIKLLAYMFEDGMQPMLGKDGLKHMKNSLHYDGLAQDIDLLDKDGNYMDKTEDHAKYGAYWKSLDPLCAWGGDFGDGNHYSVMDGGRK